MKYWLRVLFTPSCWIRNGLTDKRWDKALNYALDKGAKPDLQGSSEYTVKIGNVEIWVANYPYSYGRPYEQAYKDMYPSRRTAFRLYDFIKAQTKERAAKEKERSEANLANFLAGLENVDE